MDIIVDIDGTLADCRHRRHFVTDGNHDWKSFFESMTEDTPIEPVIKLVEYMHLNEHANIVLVTGRPEEYRYLTERWLCDKDVYFDRLLMRKTKDYRPDYVIKEEILNELKATGFNPDLVIDDRQDVVDMWRRNGIICLQNSMKELP
jgi:hypothetical protein